jgi:signal transduction histidine kinase
VDPALRITAANAAFVKYWEHLARPAGKLPGGTLASLCPATRPGWLQRELRKRRQRVPPLPLMLNTPATQVELTPVPRPDDNGWLVLLRRVGQKGEDGPMSHTIDSRIVAGITHDVKMPLQVVLGWVSMLRQNPVDADRLDEVLSIVERNTRLVIDLVQELLDASRRQGRDEAIHWTDVDLGALMQSVIDDLRPIGEAEGVTLTGPDVSAPIVVRGDARRLTRVVSNLVVNAIKFSPPGTAVECSLTTDGANAHMRIRDFGDGISAGFLPHVFDPFRREITPRRRVDGVGLGLAVVRDLVHRHGGRVRAESGGRGQGSTFTVTIPRAKPHVNRTYPRPMAARG